MRLPGLTAGARTPDAWARQRWLAQLGALLQAGIALHPALRLLQAQQPVQEQAYWSPVLTHLEQGQPLSACLEQRQALGVGDLALLRVAEQTGQLSSQLQRLAQLQARRLTLQRELRRALRYPVLALSGAMLVAGFLLTQVVPGFAELYASFDAELPLLTRQVLLLSQLLQQLAPAMLAALLVLAGLLRWQLPQRPGWRHILHRLLWHLPLTGRLTRCYWLGCWHRTLHDSLAGGLPLEVGLSQAAARVQESALAGAQEDIRRGISQGQPLSSLLADRAGYPSLCRQMVAVGEESGMLATLLDALASQFEQDFRDGCAQAIQWLEPLLMLFLGALVGLIVLALYLPMFQLGQVV
ncbi:type II secretion system F family protein [Perlucidibaca piscinae]|uniref:type II secretion system F family protein n=1 Tax=Perlucidibaca piscinae TaxID=392589 RepID=UPI0003B32D80|nr:type II secretion system F family protein [Perlucidibaca piscinae]